MENMSNFLYRWSAGVYYCMENTRLSRRFWWHHTAGCVMERPH